MLKQCIFGPTISAIPPAKYAERFTSFIRKMVNVVDNTQEEIPEQKNEDRIK